MAVARIEEDRTRKKKKDEDVTKFTSEITGLPKERSIPPDSLTDYLILIFGEKKIGKTSLTAQAKKTLHIMTEPGNKGLRVYAVQIRTWADAMKVLRLVRKDTRYASVVVDTVDQLVKAASEEVKRIYVVDDVGDEPYGKGFRKERDLVERWLNDIMSCGKGVTLISHAAEVEIQRADGKTMTKISATIGSKQVRGVIEGMVDVWAYYGYRGERRVLQIAGDENVSAGHRLDERFRTPDGKRIKRIDMGNSPAEAHANFVAAFNNKYEPPVELKEEKKKKKSFKKA